MMKHSKTYQVCGILYAAILKKRITKKILSTTVRQLTLFLFTFVKREKGAKIYEESPFVLNAHKITV